MIATTTQASKLLRAARERAQLSQRALADRAEDHQSHIAKLERAGTDANVSTLAHLLAATGGRLVVLPGQGTTVSDTSIEVADCLRAGSEDGAYRAVIQLAADLAREVGADRVARTVTPPTRTGDDRYDAFIAGVVETLLDHDHLPIPGWVAGVGAADATWFVDRWSEGDDSVVASTPEPLRRRRIIIDASELESV